MKHTIRLACSADMDTIYMMGFDAWAEGQSRGQYLSDCRASAKYAKGTWYVLEDSDGKLVCSLIIYKLDFTNAIGIGSIATAPEKRRTGHAAQLLREVINLLLDQAGSQVFYLWADVDPKYYERFEFVSLPEKYQVKTGSTLMIRCSKSIREQLLAAPEYQAPTYF